MSENFAIDAINPNLHVGSGVGIGRQTNAIKNNNIFNAFFDSAEKCQMALDVLKNGKLGNVQKYTDVIKELENKIKTQYNHADFDVQKRIELRKGWEYVEKELKLALDADVQTKKDNRTVPDVWYERVLKNATSAEKCQIIIDKILDTGSYSHFDTPEEVKKLVVLLEEKKATFENAASVESPQWREEMKAARALNKFATKKLFEEGRKLSDKVEAECEALSPWEYSGMWWEAKFTGKEEPYAQITSKYTDFIDAVCELSNDVDSLTVSEFGDKATKLLGTEKYDVELVQKLSKQHTDYQTALALKTTNEFIKLEYSKENLEKIEDVLGKSRIEKEVEGYATLSSEDKFKCLQLNLKENVNCLNQSLKNKSGEDVIIEYENNYKEFLKMVGVDNINKELDDFRTKSEIIGTATKIVFVAGASALCIMTAGAAAGALGLAAGATTITSVAGGVGAFSASSLPELYARDGEIKNNIVQQYIDNPDILAHSAIDGLTAGSATAASTVLSQVGKNALTKYGALLLADGAIGTSAAYAHAKYDGRELSGKDLALTLGVSSVTAGFGARAGARIQNTKAASHSKTSGTNNPSSKPREPRLAPMYRNKPATTTNEISITPDPVFPQYKRINLRGNEYSIEKSLARTLSNMEDGCTYKLISKNGKLIMDKSSDFYSNGYLITKENGKLILMD